MIYINKIENSIMFKMKTGYYLKLLTPETMKLHGSTKSKINKGKNGKIMSYSKILAHSNIFINADQEDSSYTFVPNKSFGQLLYISTKDFTFLKTFNSEFSYIEVWRTDQNSKPLEIEHKIDIILVIN